MSSRRARPISLFPRSLPRILPRIASGLIFAMTLSLLQPGVAAAFEWEGSRAEDATAKAVDAVLIRPLAAVRVVVGAVFLVPAAFFASPGGMEGWQGAYDVLFDAPVEYAFKRDLGDF